MRFSDSSGGRRLPGVPLALAFLLCAGCVSSPAGAPSAAPTMQQTAQEAADRLNADTQQLNQLLHQLNTSLPPQSAKQLTQTQPRWETLARDECGWQRDLSGGGSMAPLIYLTCMDQRVRERINWLKLFLCEGYGSTGECAASKRY
jgi:uncharacterized protein YecT (DUF1311 family)